MPQVTINRQIARVLIAASLLLGSIYPLIETQLAPLAGVMFKGQCVGLLAIAALLWARSTDGWLLTGVMAAGTAGDVLLGLPGQFETGAAAFGVGHILAITLYLRNRQRPLDALTLAIVAALLVAGVALPQMLVAGNTGLAVYALLLTGMTAASFASRFDRRVALGALMFLVSDALIAVRMQQPAPGMAVGLAIWWLYYFGQFLIFWFVAKAIRSGPAR
jgi:uncharacterized membrane protein YhhN